MKLQKMKLKKWISNITTILLSFLLIFMLFLVISSKAAGGEPQVFGHQLKTVLSGSMEPGIKTGSIIVVKIGRDVNSFKENDVITFKEDENKLVTHRIVEVIKSGENILYRTKGDNNKSEDMNPVLSENVVAKYTGLTIPYVGYFVEFAKSKNGSALLLILPGLLLLAYSIITIWKTISQLDLKTIKNEAGENVEKPIN